MALWGDLKGHVDCSLGSPNGLEFKFQSHVASLFSYLVWCPLLRLSLSLVALSEAAIYAKVLSSFPPVSPLHFCPLRFLCWGQLLAMTSLASWTVLWSSQLGGCDLRVKEVCLANDVQTMSVCLSLTLCWCLMKPLENQHKGWDRTQGRKGHR